jgi:hypothetical protein
MEEAFAKVEDLVGHVKEYVNNRVESAKLNMAEKASNISARFIAVMVVLVLFLFFTGFLSTALAYLLAEWTGKLYWGFLIVAGLYLVIAIVIWLAKDRLIRFPIMNAMLQQLYNEEASHEEN